MSTSCSRGIDVQSDIFGKELPVDTFTALLYSFKHFIISTILMSRLNSDARETARNLMQEEEFAFSIQTLFGCKSMQNCRTIFAHHKSTSFTLV